MPTSRIIGEFQVVPPFLTKIYTDLVGRPTRKIPRLSDHQHGVCRTGEFVIWDRVDDRIRRALEKEPNFHVEQCSFNLEIFENLEEHIENGIQFLPSTCNWMCHQAFPMYDKERECLVEPFLPYQKLGILHRASDDFKPAKCGSIHVVQGGERDMNLKYAEGDYRSALPRSSPRAKRWQDAGLE